jgi:hypothetical protein
MFLNYCNSYIRLFTIGLYYSQISNTTATFYCRLSKHTKQLPHWSTFLQQLRHSTCFTRNSSSRTVSGWLQHPTQNRTPSSLSRCSLTLDYKTSLHSHLYFLPDPTALKSNTSSVTVSGASRQPVPTLQSLAVCPPRTDLTPSALTNRFHWQS